MFYCNRVLEIYVILELHIVLKLKILGNHVLQNTLQIGKAMKGKEEMCYYCFKINM